LPKKIDNKVKKNLKQNEESTELACASNLKEFEEALQKIPLESIRFHANRNDFSKWLMARCEFKLAIKLRPQKVTDFKTLDEMRKYLIKVFNESRRDRQLGVMADFKQQKFEFDSSYTKIGGDSLGGKGRGIAFIRTLLSRYNIQQKYKDVKITVPSTIAIGTDEFDKFMTRNKLYYKIRKKQKLSDGEIAKLFLKAKLQDDLKIKLKIILKHFKKPLAVRSSSLLEDSQNYPFAGIYSTYMIPNNHEDIEKRLEQLCNAIKLVYSSIYYKNAKSYIESTSAKTEEEKMAIIIQELIGSVNNDIFYPSFSGVAQSYNYYPVSHQKREEGIVNVAVGLGYSVVRGDNVLRFSPYHPGIIPDFSTPEGVIENSQREAYVLNIKNKDIILTEKEDETLNKISISEIVKDETINDIISTYDKEDGMIRDSFTKEGPHLITFSGVLKYDTFPLSNILKEILEVGEKSMGAPVEIEFAVNFYKDKRRRPVFAIIQIRPLIVKQENTYINWNDEINRKDILLISNKSLGNEIIQNIKDIVYVSPETFDSAKTIEISKEISEINKNLKDSPYILIGPGRWGTQDRWLGIPVYWSDISNVKVMVETAFKDYNIKPTQGTHFFQNIISRGIGYININPNIKENYINWNWLKKQKNKNQLKFVKHIALDNPLTIKLDGRNGLAIIIKYK